MVRAMRVAAVVLLVVSAGVVASGPSSGQAGCHPSYPGQCIPSPPPNLNCDSAQVQFSNFPVLPPDPHGLDGNDNDGLGCESSTKPRFVAGTTTTLDSGGGTRIISITPVPEIPLRPALDRTG